MANNVSGQGTNNSRANLGAQNVSWSGISSVGTGSSSSSSGSSGSSAGNSGSSNSATNPNKGNAPNTGTKGSPDADAPVNTSTERTAGSTGSAVAGAIGSAISEIFGGGNPPPPGPGGGGGGGGGGSKYSINTNLNIPEGQTPEQIAAQRAALSAALNPEAEKVAIDRVNYYDKEPMVRLMEQEIEAERQRYNNSINQSMDNQARDLNRSVADAQNQFQTQQNQITAEEMNARDNAALYAEARGDKGGIGQAQYNSIMNTAAQNRLAVRQAQTKVATDVARQISDLRSNGEFEKADKMLALTQEKLSQLRQIEEYAANYNLNVDQVNTAIAEWEYNFNQAAQQFATNLEMSLAQLTGSFSNGTPTYEASQTLQQNMANMALSLIQAGVKPTQLSPEMLGALSEMFGMDQTAINAAYKKFNKK